MTAFAVTQRLSSGVVNQIETRATTNEPVLASQVPPLRGLHTAWNVHADRTLQEEPGRGLGTSRFTWMLVDTATHHTARSGHAGRTLQGGTTHVFVFNSVENWLMLAVGA